MSGAEAIRRLWRERQEWRRAGEGPEVSWTVRGIEISLRVLRNLVKEQRIRMMEQRPRIARWLAADLYRAVRVALDQIKRGDRAKAIATLEKAMEAVRGKG